MTESGDKLHAALVRLEEAVAATGSGASAALEPGLAEDEIRSRLEPLGIDAPEDLIVLFGWHNGHRTAPGRHIDQWMGPNLWFMNLDQACADLVTLQDGLEYMMEFGSYDRSIGPDWFPILGSTSTIWSLMNCGSTDPRRGYVAEIFDVLPETLTTLAVPVERWVEFIETGLWTWDSTKGWTDHRNWSEVPQGHSFL